MKRVFEPLRSSIRRWLLWVLSASLTAVMVANGWRQFLSIDAPINAAFDHALLDDAYAVSAHLRVTSEGIAFDLAEGAEDVLRTDPDDAFFFLVTGPRGEYVAGDRDLPVAALHGGGSGDVFEASYRGEGVRGVRHRHSTALGEVTVNVAQTLRARQAIEADFVASLLVSKAVQIGIVLLVVYVVVGAGLRPLLRLSREIDARGSNLLAPVAQDGLPAELQPLAGALNRLLGVIDSSTRAQRRFLEDASHQLRTPLAGLQGQLEVLTHEEGLPEALRARIAELHLATQRLSHLSSRLLALGRSDGLTDPSIQTEPQDLAQVVEECASVFLDRALAKDMDLGFEAACAPLVGSAWMLRELASNLIENAIAYSPPGGRVTVRSRMFEGRPVLEVEDNGPGIEPSERHRVFDRFYRGRHDDGMGCGLGLAIVKQIADAHGADVTILDPESGAGSLVRVSFPKPAVACGPPPG